MKKLIIGNWKMNFLKQDVNSYAKQFEVLSRINPLHVNYGFAVPSLYLIEAKQAFKGLPQAIIAAQNCFYGDAGAYTGETSFAQLQAIGVNFALIGHSERRNTFNETDAMINNKVRTLLVNDMSPILCIGEVWEERASNNHFDVIEKQLNDDLAKVDASKLSKLIIAYEPVWAIGTGKSATSADAENMCNFIREKLAIKYGKDVANSIYILYGGSVNTTNVNEYLSQPSIDGALVGGASLIAKDFIELLKAVKHE